MSFVPRGSIGAVVLAVTLGVASASHAQTRPTLEDVESRVDTLESEVTTLETELDEVRGSTCIAADVHGDTYRPAHCDARCDCIGGAVAEVAACRVETMGPSTNYSIDGYSPGYQCLDLGVGTSCVNLTAPCSGDGDCTAPYDTCFQGFCVIVAPCVTDADCPFVPPSVISDVWGISTTTGGVDSDVATCHRDDLSGTVTFTTNHKDAVECVAQVEAQLGQACTPVP